VCWCAEKDEGGGAVGLASRCFRYCEVRVGKGEAPLELAAKFVDVRRWCGVELMPERFDELGALGVGSECGVLLLLRRREQITDRRLDPMLVRSQRPVGRNGEGRVRRRHRQRRRSGLVPRLLEEINSRLRKRRRGDGSGWNEA